MAAIKASTRNVLRLFLVLLIITVIALAYTYYVITRPPAEVYQGVGLTHLFSIYGYGTNPDEQLKQPHDVAFDSRGNIYITDAGHRRVLVFGRNGGFLRSIGRPGAGPGEFTLPVGIDVGDDGRVYVADELAGKVAIFNSRGRLLREFRVMMPLKPFVFGNRLYLTNYGFVNVYDLDGKKRLERWGKKGRDQGEFDLPAGLAVFNHQSILVADLNNLRVQALGRDGRVRWVAGEPGAQGATNRTFGLPAAIAVDEAGRSYVVDAFDQQIKVLDANGKNIAALSREGKGEGELYFPSGIAYRGQGVFAVADKFNDRVQVLKLEVN